jgi:hypothetical protein
MSGFVVSTWMVNAGATLSPSVIGSLRVPSARTIVFADVLNPEAVVIPVY